MAGAGNSGYLAQARDAISAAMDEPCRECGQPASEDRPLTRILGHRYHAECAIALFARQRVAALAELAEAIADPGEVPDASLPALAAALAQATAALAARLAAAA